MALVVLSRVYLKGFVFTELALHQKKVFAHASSQETTEYEMILQDLFESWKFLQIKKVLKERTVVFVKCTYFKFFLPLVVQLLEVCCCICYVQKISKDLGD